MRHTAVAGLRCLRILATVLARLGTWCHNRRWTVILVWLALLVGAGAASGAAGGGFSTQFSPPDVESARGIDIIEEHFGGTGGGFGGTIVFVTDAGVTDPTVQTAMTRFLAAVDEIDSFGQLSVVSPYSPEGQGQIAPQGALAGQVAFARVEVSEDVTVEDGAEITEEVQDLAPEIAGLRIEYGGQLFAAFAPPESEAVGLGFAIVILIVGFGSVLAMGLPVGTAVAGIGFGTAIVTLLSHVVTMPEFTTTIAIMIGLGVGIDYALFIVTRYREGLHAGLGSSDAMAIAINTAGRAVIFAGTTVVISLLGMLLMGLGFVNGLAIGAATVVAVTMVASVTLLPALVGLAGPRIEVTRWRGIIASGLVAIALVGVGLGAGALLVALPAAAIVVVAGLFLGPLKREVPRRAARPIDQTLAYRWSRLIQARPWPAVIIGSVVLIVLALPVFALRLGFSDEGNFPEDTSTRRAYDLVTAGFGPGFNGPLVLASELPAGFDAARLARVSDAVSATNGVAFATPAAPNDPAAPTAVLWRVIPTTAPQDEATGELLHRIRRDVLPEATAGTDLDIAVTGNVAISADFSEYLGDRLPVFLAVVLGLSFLLLMTVFRSLLVPLKAVVMNLISIGAAYGLVVAVFQWGWGKDLIGLGKGGPIEPFVPMMMFAILFGLSMDYEVFLLSRIKEEYDRHGDNAKAVADGLASTARVITAAAAIMVVVFGSFLLESDRVVKLFGIGLASAIFLDATIVRMLLVPATMELLGDRNWWLPRWLHRLLPKVDIDGARAEPARDPTPDDLTVGV
jgi:RND superfamily putative drug exporter